MILLTNYCAGLMANGSVDVHASITYTQEDVLVDTSCQADVHSSICSCAVRKGQVPTAQVVFAVTDAETGIACICSWPRFPVAYKWRAIKR
jgi:hypothetical protein